MENGKIYGLIGQAMNKIGAIGKNSVNSQQGFKYRGIDAVYNALNPVMAELGLFICPEVLDQQREERTTAKGATLIYTVLTMKYTVYAPDGSNVSVVVVGEGMDSGDKSSNKAMSVAMKYAMFQLFFIPTEDLIDPDAECHTDVLPKKAEPKSFGPRKEPKAQVETSAAVPGISAEMAFLQGELGKLATEKNSTMDGMKTVFEITRKAGIKKGVLPDKKVTEYTLDEIKAALEIRRRDIG